MTADFSNLSGDANKSAAHRFRVVPPTAKSPEAKTPHTKAVSATDAVASRQAAPQAHTKPEKKRFPYTGWLIFAGIVASLGAISQIPVSPSVRAEAWLEADPQTRSVVHLSIPGKITEVLVVPNQTVQKDQPIALVESLQLDEAVGEWNLRALESTSRLEAANQQVETARARVDSARAISEGARQRVEQLQQEVEAMEAGFLPPHIGALESQRKSLEASAQSLEVTIGRYERLAQAGALALEKVNELRRQKSALLAQVAAIEAQRETAKRQLSDELKAQQEELNRLVTSRVVAEQELGAARVSVDSQRPVLETLRSELVKRQHRQAEAEVLRAPLAGTVMTQSLFSLKGKTLQAGEAVLEIADPSELVAVIEVRQEEADLVKAGASVTFNPLEAGLPSFTTKIQEVEVVLERDAQLQQSRLRLRALIDAPGKQLKPGAKVYARIGSSEEIKLYQKVHREFLNLFKVRKYS